MARELQPVAAGKIAKKGRLPCSKTVPFFSKTAPLLAVFSCGRGGEHGDDG